MSLKTQVMLFCLSVALTCFVMGHYSGQHSELIDIKLRTAWLKGYSRGVQTIIQAVSSKAGVPTPTPFPTPTYLQPGDDK